VTTKTKEKDIKPRISKHEICPDCMGRKEMMLGTLVGEGPVYIPCPTCYGEGRVLSRKYLMFQLVKALEEKDALYKIIERSETVLQDVYAMIIQSQQTENNAEWEKIAQRINLALNGRY
jgi:DnaJ-class molecular chaperone